MSLGIEKKGSGIARPSAGGSAPPRPGPGPGSPGGERYRECAISGFVVPTSEAVWLRGHWVRKVDADKRGYREVMDNSSLPPEDESTEGPLLHINSLEEV